MGIFPFMEILEINSKEANMPQQRLWADGYFTKEEMPLARKLQKPRWLVVRYSRRSDEISGLAVEWHVSLRFLTPARQNLHSSENE